MKVNADEVIYGLASRSHGVVLRHDLLDAGVGRGAIERRVGRGALGVVGRGVYCVSSLQTEKTSWQLAVVLVRGSALSHVSAARIHRLLSGGPGVGEVHLVGPIESRRPAGEAVVLHRTKHLPSADITEVAGLRVTSPERTLCDLATVLRPRRLQNVIENSVVAERCEVGRLLACRSAYVRRGRVGSARLNLVLDELFDDQPMVDSELERRMIRLLGDFSISGFVLHFRPEWFDGLRGAVDFAHREARVIIEVDGRRWHSVTQAFDDDRRRDRRAQSNGWVVLRFGWHEVVHRSAAVAAEIKAIIDARLA